MLIENYEDDENEGKGSQFSESSIIVMLKKLLHCEESIQEDIILGNWKFAPTRCLIEFQPVRDSGLPLILCHRSFESLDRVLIDIFSKEITIANILDLGFAKCMYTKEGWLLFRRARPAKLPGAGFFLHNIFTGERLDLPDSGGYKAAPALFSTSSSSVDYVVHVRREFRSGRTTIHVASPGDEAWEVYTKQQRRGYDVDSFAAVIISGKKVYCFDYGEDIIVFDLMDRRWLSVTGLQQERYGFHIMEVDGKIVKVCPPNPDLNLYRFFRLEMDGHDRASWEEMSELELENRSWFVGPVHSFCVKGGMEAVYELTSHRLGGESGQGFGMNIRVYDLTEGTTRHVFPFPIFEPINSCWVDLG